MADYPTSNTAWFCPDTTGMPFTHREPHYARLAAEFCESFADLLRRRPTAWTQGVYARNSDGCVTDPTGPEATQVCILGYLARWCRGNIDLHTYIADKLAGALHTFSVPCWNDHPLRTVSEVIESMDHAARKFRSMCMPDWNSMAAKKLSSFESVIENIEHEAA